MRLKTILLPLILAMFFGTPVFAAEDEFRANNVFIDVEFYGLDNPQCGADGEFRVIQVIPRQQQNNEVDFEIVIFSVLVNLSNGVVGQGFTQTPQSVDLNSPSDLYYNILCYDSLKNSQNIQKRILIEKEDPNSNLFYDVKINDKKLGSVAANFDYLQTSNIIEKNSNFLIVTGADACNSYGSFRMVNINHEPNTKTNYEIDVSSLFFNKVSITENGKTKNTFAIVGSGIISYTASDPAKKIVLDNNINCLNIGDAKEKFELTLNEDGQASLNLPPIRSHY